MMASPGNSNQPAAGGPFDLHKFFKPSPPVVVVGGATVNPIPQNPNSSFSSSPFPPTSFPPPHSTTSYPPPTAGPYSYPPQTSPYHHPQYLHHHIPPFPLQQQLDSQFSNLSSQKSISYPSPPLQPPSPRQFQPPQNPSPNPGARLMALLSAPPPSTLEIPQQLPSPTIPMQPSLQPLSSSGGSSDFPMPPSIPIMPPPGTNATPGVISHPPMRMPSSKLPKGRHLVGDRLVYDIDVRLPGEVQPQLEVTPITKYGSDPGLVLGRQIAVNRTYICYGLKLGTIRVLNINTALRSLLKGLSQRVTDMAFFAEDVHLLAGASNDGRVYVWNISEGPDDEDKPQITGKIVVAIQIVGEGESVYPRVCWHCHKQEVLVVGIGRNILRIDTTKVGKGEVYTSEEPLKCPVDKLIDGVQLVGTHDGEVTDLSMCQWMTTRLVSASFDGTIKIWEDRRLHPIAVLRPHDGQPVDSVTFLTSPHRPDHIILITGGPLNREVKIWASSSEEGWLLPSEAESWHCTQALELRSSAEGLVEEAFFNQVAALSPAGLLLLANAKKNAIYVIHFEYGPNPSSSRMDYIAEFTVTMPILSFTGTSEILAHGEQIVQVYCVQTQAIQQYALGISQCFPSNVENVVFERSDSSFSHDSTNADRFSTMLPSGNKGTDVPLTYLAPQLALQNSSESSTVRYAVNTAGDTTTSQELAASRVAVSSSSLTSVDSDIVRVPCSLPLSPSLSRKLSETRSPANTFDPDLIPSNHVAEQKVVEYSVDRQVDSVHTKLSDVPFLDDEARSDENMATPKDNSAVLNHPVNFRQFTHLVTPAEIMMGSSSSDKMEQKVEGEWNIQDVSTSDVRSVEVEVKILGETESRQNNESGTLEDTCCFVTENKEKSFCSQASDLGIEMSRDRCALSTDAYIVESRQVDLANGSSHVVLSYTEDEVQNSVKVVAGKIVNSTVPATLAQPSVPSTKGKKSKGKNTQGSGLFSPLPSNFNSADSSIEPGVSSIPSTDAVLSQIAAIQEAVNQLGVLQKEMHKQMATIITSPVTKESRRLETALGRIMEKVIKSNVDAMWSRFQEESFKQEKLTRDRMQQVTNSISNFMNKELPATVEKTMKKELATFGPAMARTITPSIEKTVSSAIAETFQRGVIDKAVSQLEKSVNAKLEATVARQIQAQFQTSGKQALQEALKSSLETSVIPAFDVSCATMFEQVDAAFQKGMVEHSSAAHLQLESMHSQLALALRDAVNSASSMTQMLTGELADGQRKLLALAISGASPKAGSPLVSQLNNGPLAVLHEKIETPLDPTRELSRMISERKFEEAFTAALQRSDVSIVSWLCSQVDLQGILSTTPLSLSQGVLISLLQQLACDLSKDTPRKLSWMRDVVVAINPADPLISFHVRPIFDQVYQILNHHRGLPTIGNAEISSIRIVMHILNSMLLTCK